MSDNWSNKFNKKLQEKEMASQAAAKNFQVYKEASLKLFDHIEQKVRSIQAINVVRTVVGDSGPTPGPIKALNLKLGDKILKFVPEGINPDSSRGRIRIEHNCKSLSKFVYLHLIVDLESEAAFPNNLVWKFNASGDDISDFNELPHFDDEKLEKLMETCFLAE